MRKIWKSEIEPNSTWESEHRIKVPARVGSRAISVGIQNDRVVVWFEVDPQAAEAYLTLWCVGTGWGVVPDGKRFIGTVQHEGHVWHLYG